MNKVIISCKKCFFKGLILWLQLDAQLPVFDYVTIVENKGWATKDWLLYT